MKLKVIRYKNYGCQMESEDDEDQFYFSFYELNNGEIIELTLIENTHRYE
jgi:predicted Fe-Mo cluster-binding NifX family protein|tara:strand:+ start:482 stop:631 length:150 start_codon:yes stop_codon:yes gene_type:complete